MKEDTKPKAVEDVCDVDGVFMRATYIENKALKCVQGRFSVHNSLDHNVVVQLNVKCIGKSLEEVKGKKANPVVVKPGATTKLGMWAAPAALMINWEWAKEEPKKKKSNARTCGIQSDRPTHLCR